MTEIRHDIPLSPVRTALKEERLITELIEQQTFGLAYPRMRAQGQTPLGVRDNAQKLVQWYSEGAIKGKRAEMSLTPEEAQAIVDSIDTGKYTKALDILEKRGDVLNKLIAQEEQVVNERMASYEEQNPELVAEYDRLCKQRRYARLDILATEEIAEKVQNHSFRQFQEETSRYISSLRQCRAEYSVYSEALKGETTEY